MLQHDMSKEGLNHVNAYSSHECRSVAPVVRMHECRYKQSQ